MERDGGESAGPSLFLARHEIAHREHVHQHNKFHRRQTAILDTVAGGADAAATTADILATAAQTVVTEIVATVSVVQIVDSNGSTVAIQTLPDGSPNSGAATTTASSGPGMTTEPAAPLPTTDPSIPSTAPASTPPINTATCQAQKDACQAAPDRNESFCSANYAQCVASTCQAQRDACQAAPDRNESLCAANYAQCVAPTCQAQKDACQAAPDRNESLCAANYAQCIASGPIPFSNLPALPVSSGIPGPAIPSPPVSSGISGPAIPSPPVSSTISAPPQPGTSPPLSLASTQSATSISPSIPSSRPSLASYIISSNSSTLISSSSSLVPTFSNNTIASARSSLTYLISSYTTTDGSFPTSITTPFESIASDPASATNTDGNFVFGTRTASRSTPSSTGTSDNGTDSGSSSTPSSAVVAGGVVGGLAGAAVIIFLLMFLVRWKKRNRNILMLGNGDRSLGSDTIGGNKGENPQPRGGMSERPTTIFAVPAALASLTGYKRWSEKTETNQTISSTAGSERGFYRVSGRKLPSVLQTGGDGYGGGSSVPEDHTFSGSSFYRDSHGFYGGAGSPLGNTAGASAAAATTRESGVPIMRPSPARTPVTEHPPFFAGSVPPLTPPPRRPDLVGRSHPSQDGSHISRFMEEV